MNCKIESMNENRKTHIDSLPPRGRVNEVRRNWLVHEDGALAYRLQDEEIKQHLIGNRSRNIQIREDFPRAKDEQQKEAEEAARLHQQLLLQQEQQDAKIAAQLADHIEKEEEERKRMLEEEDKELAKLLQQKEHYKISKRERDFRKLETHTLYEEKRNLVQQRPMLHKNFSERSDDPVSHSSNQNPLYYDDNLSDINNVGLPLQDDIVQPLRNCNLSHYSGYKTRTRVSPSPVSEDEARRIQEEKDEEYARFLQEKENLENLDTVNRDRLLAIETQDKELARLLQEKERAKARRARERAKQKAALKRMQEESSVEAVVDGENVIKVAETVPVNCHRKLDDDMISHKDISPVHANTAKNTKSKPRYPDPEEIVELPVRCGSITSGNIAMTIDPTFTRENLERNHRSKKNLVKACKVTEESQSSAASRTDITEDVNAPPYMPIQGQRRLLEKKPKQKDGCKQQ